MFAQILAWFLVLLPSGDLVAAEGRFGLRLSPGDLSPQLGVTAELWRVAGTFEGWIRPFRWRTTVEESPMVVSRYQELRYGTNQGVRLRLAGDTTWFALAGGTEWIHGDWAGTVKRPESQVVPWVGFELHVPATWARIRFCTESNRNGWFRLELFIGFRSGESLDFPRRDPIGPPSDSWGMPDSAESSSKVDSSAVDSTISIHGPGDQP